MTGRSLQSGCGSWSSRADLQETVWGNGYDQASALPGPDYELARHASRSADGVGAVLASRWPFSNIREVDLHVTERVDDLPWAAAVTAEPACGSSPGGSRWTSSPLRDAWEAAHPGEPGHTFTPSNPLVRDGEWSQELGRRIDYVLVRCGIRGPSLQIVHCHRIFDQAVDGVWASDHFGVFADLQVPA